MSTKNWKKIPDATKPVPNGSGYVLWIKDVAKTPSKKGAPMITLKMEVLAPDQVETAEGPVMCSGRKVTHWLAFTDNNKRAYEDLDTLLKGVPEIGGLPDEIDPTDLPLYADVLVGKVLNAVELQSEPRYVEVGGVQVVDPATGQAKIAGYNTRIVTMVPAYAPSALGITLPPK
jgi:hypothetical protein